MKFKDFNEKTFGFYFFYALLIQDQWNIRDVSRDFS
jgi:hypothetical protein